jgi:hypothetical protein
MDPLFLVGAPRSGSTLLYKSLCLHPGVTYISNWVRVFPGAPGLAFANRLASHAPRAQRAVWFAGGGAAYVYGERRSWWHRAFPMPVEGEPVYERAGVPGAADGPLPDAAAGLRASFARVARASGRSHLVSKRIANNRRIPFLLDAFPAARFVELVRDGRAVAASLARVDWWPESRLWWNGDESPREAEAAGADPWELCARAWVEETAVTSAGLARVPAGQVLSTTYERFVAEPHAVLAEVASFAGIPADPVWARRLAGVEFPDRNRAWRTQLSPAAVATIERVQRPALARYSYE